MSNSPAGWLRPTADGHDLVLVRTWRAPVEDVWASVTEPERTARWFGAWQGDAAPGAMIRLQMAYEDQAPWVDARIEVCDPPRRLALSTVDDAGSWQVELQLTHTGGVTELQFVQHLSALDGLGEVGPGWEYYLDMLVAARGGLPAPVFDDYYPAMKSYYDALPGRAGGNS